MCAECHPEALKAWSGSHHDRAMEEVGHDAVLGDFDDAVLEHAGLTHRFFRRDGEFFVATPGPDGEPGEFRVRYTFGAEPLQQYLVDFPGGRLQALPFAWDSRPADVGGQRWYHLYPDPGYGPDDPLHWTGVYQTWNTMCAECHSTHLEKRFDESTDSYATTWAEIDVSCEACHGPAGDHVAWARAGAGDGEVGLVVDFANGGSRAEVEACARCHSRRHRVGPEDAHGRPLLDDFVPAGLREGLYFADGQNQDEVYVYGSFVQSRMYERGVRCSDCHEPHGLGLRAEGNALCARCHGPDPDPRFPTLLAKIYDAPAHHFHETGTAGAQCVNCHMPARTYMGVDERRDHGFRIPRPDLTAEIGTPNACNGCHEDREPEWAAGAIADVTGETRRPDGHFALAIAGGRRGDPAAVESLAGWVADPEAPTIVRVSALDLLHSTGPVGAEVAVAASRERDPWLRARAASALDALPLDSRITAAAPLLDDPIRAVRIEAARVLADVPPDHLTPTAREALDRALAEYEAVQRADADLPGSHLNRAVVHAARGRTDEAVRAYRIALRIDPSFHPARQNLAMLLNRAERNDEAIAELRAGLERAPDEGEFHYSLGLLLAEEDRLAEAESHLARAAAEMPRRARVAYNHGLALQGLGRRAGAEEALRRAALLDPEDPQVVYGLAALYLQQGRLRDARPLVARLVATTPDAGPRQMLERIDAALSREAAPR